MTDLKGARVLVTGAARGLGRSMVEDLAGRGARVLAVDIDRDGLEDTAAACEQVGAEVYAEPCDVADAQSVAAAVAAAAARLGGLDGVVNNAAIVAVTRAPAGQITLEEFDRVYAVNVRGPWLMYRAAMSLLSGSSHASVVNLSSETAFSGSSNLAHYVASKAAVLGLTRALAQEGGPLGIRVNAVAPGFTDTEGARALGAPATYDTSRTPLGRVALPQDVVGAVAFLLGGESAFVTGQSLLINGGRVMF